MINKKLNDLTEEELLAKRRKLKRSKIISAMLIGFCVGIIIWSVAKNTWGFLTLIPLFFIYKMVNNSKKGQWIKLKNMNKYRIIGITFLLIGIIFVNAIENDLSSFVSGILIGIGGILIISGKTILSKKSS